MQGFGDALDVFFVVGLAGDFEDYLLEAVGHFGLVVVEFDDVGVFFGEDAGDVEELAGFIRQEYTEAEYAATGNFCLFNQGGNRGYIDIAAADDGGYFFALEGELGEGGKGQHACAFGDEFVFFNEGEQSAHDFHFGNSDDVVEVFFAEFIGERARSLYGTAVGYGVGGF